jgi:hypothetical protein
MRGKPRRAQKSSPLRIGIQTKRLYWIWNRDHQIPTMGKPREATPRLMIGDWMRRRRYVKDWEKTKAERRRSQEHIPVREIRKPVKRTSGRDSNVTP